MLSQLRSICDLVLRFQTLQELLCQDGVREVARRDRAGARSYGKQLAVRLAVV
jgi:hypothetical protein